MQLQVRVATRVRESSASFRPFRLAVVFSRPLPAEAKWAFVRLLRSTTVPATGSARPRMTPSAECLVVSTSARQHVRNVRACRSLRGGSHVLLPRSHHPQARTPFWTSTPSTPMSLIPICYPRVAPTDPGLAHRRLPGPDLAEISSGVRSVQPW